MGTAQSAGRLQVGGPVLVRGHLRCVRPPVCRPGCLSLRGGQGRARPAVWAPPGGLAPCLGAPRVRSGGCVHAAPTSPDPAWSPLLVCMPPGPGPPSVRLSSMFMCPLRVCLQASCGRFQPGLVPVSVSVLQGTDRTLGPHGPWEEGGSGPASPGGNSAVRPAAADEGRGKVCWPAPPCIAAGSGGAAEAGDWVVPGRSPEVGTGAVQRQIAPDPLQWWPWWERGPNHGAYRDTGGQMTAGCPAHPLQGLSGFSQDLVSGGWRQGWGTRAPRSIQVPAVLGRLTCPATVLSGA